VNINIKENIMAKRYITLALDVTDEQYNNFFNWLYYAVDFPGTEGRMIVVHCDKVADRAKIDAAHAAWTGRVSLTWTVPGTAGVK
jgi:hypothetical protein